MAIGSHLIRDRKIALVQISTFFHMRKLRVKLLVISGTVLLVLFALALSINTTCCSERLSKDDLSKLTELATHGDVSSMQRLRFFYEESGESEKARYWLEQGAKNGDPLAELHLANQLLSSKNLADEQLGMKYLISAAEHGEPLAQELLGERYRDGKIVEKRVDLAEFWFRKSAGSGYLSGIFSLVNLLAERAKTKEDYTECLLWNAKGLASSEIKQGGATYIDLIHQRERILKDAKAAGFTFP